jgi:DNA-directed RNA polymerase delta subunit
LKRKLERLRKNAYATNNSSEQKPKEPPRKRRRRVNANAEEVEDDLVEDDEEFEEELDSDAEEMNDRLGGRARKRNDEEEEIEEENYLGLVLFLRFGSDILTSDLRLHLHL